MANYLEEAKPNMTPMIDVVFLLIIFFLCIEFKTLEANGFRYFDFPGIPPDADDLGLLLRLFSLSTRQQAHRQILQTPLGWLRQNMAESGEIPVWFTCLDGNETTQPALSLWGQSCAFADYDTVRVFLGRGSQNAFVEIDTWITQYKAESGYSLVVVYE